MRIGNKKILVSFFMIIVWCLGCSKRVELLPECITIILDSNEVYSAKINRLGNYDKYELEDGLCEGKVEITETEVEDYINLQLESLAQLVNIEDRKIIEKGDVVVVIYMVQQNGETINQVTSDILMVGSNNYDLQFEKVLIGKRIGEPFSEELVAPNGEKMVFHIIVESISYFEIPELTDQLVQDKYSLNSVEEYYDSCRKFILNERIRIEKEREKEALLEKIMKESKFSLNKEEISKFSLQFVEIEKNLASIYELDLDTYINTILNTSKDIFFQKCYEQGEYEVKKYLLIGAIFSDLEYSISEHDKELMCEKMGYKYQDVIKDKYTNAIVEYAIMEQKVWEYLE